MTRRIYLLNGIIVCSTCGRRLRAQTPKNQSGYYREVSHLNGFQDCLNSHTSVRSALIDEQIADLVCSLKLPLDWDREVRKMLQEKDGGPDPEIQRKEIREQLRRMRVGYERGMYKDEEHAFWREADSLKERLDMLEHPQTSAINRAAKTLLNLRNSWENATREEQRELAQMMLEEVGCSVVEKRVVWIKPRLGFEILFQLVGQLQPAENGRFRLNQPNGHKGHSGTQGYSFPGWADNSLTSENHECTMPDKGIKREIAQRQLSDLGREGHAMRKSL